MFGKIVDDILVQAPRIINANRLVDGRNVLMTVSNPLDEDLRNAGYKEVVSGAIVEEVPAGQYKTVEYVDGEQIVCNDILHDKVVHEEEKPSEELEDNRMMYVQVVNESETEIFKSWIVQEKPIEVQGEMPECGENQHLEYTDMICKASIHRTYRAVDNETEGE